MDWRETSITPENFTERIFPYAEAFTKQTWLGIITPIGIIRTIFFIRKNKMKTT
jgi:hypothetical protein